MRAFISDIHANIEALCAVMKDIEHHGVNEIICLGDIVGYGPDPEACIDFVMEKAPITLMGNHDFALVNAPIGFNPMAAEIIHLTQKIMDPRTHPDVQGKFESGPQPYVCCQNTQLPQCLLKAHTKVARWNFMEMLIDRYQEPGILCVHASPLEPIFEYVYPDWFGNGWNPERIQELFIAVERVAMYGHTHHPCAIVNDLTCINPPDCGYHYTFDPEKKYLINIGSVGQPRDKDPRASYVLMDDDGKSIEWRRVSYDVQATVQKIYKMCGAGNWCGARLLEGR
jgi:predicted phosphodiesterase